MSHTILKRPMISIIIFCISLLAAVSLSRSVYSLWRKRDYVRERADRLAWEQAEKARIKKEIKEAQKPEFIEKEAREKLGMTKEGETVVIMPNDKLQMTNGKTDEKTPVLISNWKKWWRLFF